MRTSWIATFATMVVPLSLVSANSAWAEPTPRVAPCTGVQTGWYTSYSSGDNIDTDVSACIYVNGSGQMNIGGWATHTWSQTVGGTNVQFGCYWTNSPSLEVTYGWMLEEVDTNLVDGEYVSFSNTTATNWDVHTKQWAAGAGWWFPDTTTLDPNVIAAMQPPANDVGGCDAASNGMPSIALTATPPGPVGTYSARAQSTLLRAARVSDFYSITVTGLARKPLTARCSPGADLIEAEGAYMPKSSADRGYAPAPIVRGSRATLPATSGLPGYNHFTVMCYRTNAHLVRLAATVIGTIHADTWKGGATGVTVLAGQGGDRVRVRGASVALGGVGRDALQVAGRDAVVDGGMGADHLKATAAARTLLIGGPGRDTFIGSSGKTYINAADGEQDTVRCQSARNRVIADPQDVLMGPCTVVKLS